MSSDPHFWQWVKVVARVKKRTTHIATLCTEYKCTKELFDINM